MSEEANVTAETEAVSDIAEAEITAPEVDSGATEATEKDQDKATEAVEKDDMVSEALKEQERLKAELDALKNKDKDIFEQNEQLKAELEKAQKLAALAEENAKLQSQLEAIKREAITKQLIASGALTGKMKEWADGLTFDQLQEFAKMAPKRKTILDQTNNSLPQPALDMREWQKQQMKSRIIS